MDYEQTVSFGAVLIAAGEMDEAKELQYYYERPDKWQREYDSYVAAGEPDFGTPEFTTWVISLADDEE